MHSTLSEPDKGDVKNRMVNEEEKIYHVSGTLSKTKRLFGYSTTNVALNDELPLRIAKTRNISMDMINFTGVYHNLLRPIRVLSKFYPQRKTGNLIMSRKKERTFCLIFK